MLSIPFNRDFRKINSREYGPDMELKNMPELSVMRKTGGKYVLYSPLNRKIYVLSKDEYGRFRKNGLDESEKKSFFEEDLIISKETDPYERLNARCVGPTIFFTNRCNLKCIYCFSRGGDTSGDNSFERIKALIDFWRDSPGDCKKERVSFFSSGEPTLAFGLMKKTHDYINRTFKKRMEVSLISNGTFPEPVADWIIKNDINLQIGCDGPPYIQDFQRPSRSGPKSSKMIENNIRHFLKRGYRNFHTHAVITTNSLNRMDEILNYLHRLGVERVSFAEMFVLGRATKGLFVDMEDYVKNLMKIIELSETYGIECSVNIINKNKVSSKSCGAGTMLALLEDGSIATCHNALENDDVSRFFTIGKYDEKTKRIRIDSKKRTLIAERTADKIEKCRNCVLKWNCGGSCPFNAFSEHKTIFSVDYRCDAIKLAFEKFVDYKIEKEFIRIKPALEMLGKDLHYSMIFNRFKLFQTSSEEVKPNSFIKISGKTNLGMLAKNIIKARDSKGYETSVFLLSLNLSEKNLNKDFGNKVINFLEILKKNRIFFVMTKPVCRQLFGEKYGYVLNEFKMPGNWFKSLEFFKLKGKEAVLINGKTVRIKNGATRDDLCRELRGRKEITPPFKKCKFCVYGMRKNCGYRFA